MRTKITFLFVLISLFAFATHERGGYITYSVSGNQYTFRIYTWTNAQSVPSDRCELTLWIDGVDSIVCPRVNGTTPCASDSTQLDGVIIIPGSGSYGGVKENIYQSAAITLTAGTHIFTVIDPNRDAGIINLGGASSQNVVFALTDTLFLTNTINGMINNAPLVAYPSIDNVVASASYTYNPGVSDPDNDSLVFEISKSLEDDPNNAPAGVQFIFSQTIPAGLSIDHATGQLTWSPVVVQQGEYVISIRIKEYRRDPTNCANRYLIGTTHYDVQFLVVGGGASVAFNSAPQNTCVLVGAPTTFTLSATSSGGTSSINLATEGSPMSLASLGNLAHLNTVQTGTTATASFSWTPSYQAISTNAYPLVFKAYDSALPANATYQPWFIKVVSPGVTNLSANSSGTSVQVSWNPPATYTGNSLFQYDVWRSDSCITFSPSSCEVDPPQGCTYLGSTFNSAGNNAWTDNSASAGTHQYFIVPRFMGCSRGMVAASSCAMVAIEERASESFTVLPNPSSGKFKLKWQGAVYPEVKISVKDILGSNVNCPVAMDKNAADVDLSLREKGLYFIEVTSGKGSFVKKVIVE